MQRNLSSAMGVAMAGSSGRAGNEKGVMSKAGPAIVQACQFPLIAQLTNYISVGAPQSSKNFPYGCHCRIDALPPGRARSNFTSRKRQRSM